MPSNHRYLHAFDLRSVVLFTSLTLGGTTAVLAAPPAPAGSKSWCINILTQNHFVR